MPHRLPRRPGGGAPRPGWPAPPRCCAGSTPWWSTAPAGIPAWPPAAKIPWLPPPASRRPPDQRSYTSSRTTRCPGPTLPDEGRASPLARRGPTSRDTLGSSPLVARSFSPARLNAVGAGLHGRARLHYVEREAPGHKAPALPHHRGTSLPAQVGASTPANGPPTRNHPGPEATRASRSNTRPGQRHQSKINNEIPQYRLTHILLRWCLYDGQCRPFLWLRNGTHPLAVGPVKPWPLIQTRQIRPAAPAVPENLGPADRSSRRTTHRRQPNRRSGRDPGP